MQCPGQDSRYWDGEAVFESRCPKCGAVIEFFKDDSKRRCRHCDHEVLNPRIDFGCASYCPFAEQCLGSLPPEMLAQKQDLLIEKVALEMKRRHGEDFQKIGHASRAARFAEKLAKAEEANKAVVVLAAYLAEINDTPDSASSMAKTILLELKANEALSDEVCTLVAHRAQTPAPEASNNSRVFHDAWNLAGIASLTKDDSTFGQAQKLAKTLVTANGQQEAATLLA